MIKKIFMFGILSILMIFATGCTKYAYDIEIDEKNNASFKETIGINKNVYKYTLSNYEEVIDADYKTLEKEASQKGFKVEPFEDDNFKGIIKSKNNIKITKLNNSVLPAGFTTEGRSPVYIVKNCIVVKYIVSLKYNIYDAKDAHKYFIKKYRTNEGTINVIKEKISNKNETQEAPEKAIEEEQAEPTQEAIEENKTDTQNDEEKAEVTDEKQVMSDEEIKNALVPDVELRIKIPKKAKKHNATKVLNDYEYVWNLDSNDDVIINLEFEKPNIPSIIVLIFILIGGVALLVIYLKNREEE